ncbi:MAG: methyltransferase domain-containing protein [Planctomycetes bacterium]|nr:methyltransferase domain-containing protein [Planctomycetota bacterium]
MTHEAKVTRKYDVWSKFYDHTFGKLVEQRVMRAIRELRPAPGERVLDMGIGTGMTLEHYPNHVRIVGVDMSAGMLRQAAQKVERRGLTNVELVQADALRTPFADASFDHILITHVISVVHDPIGLLHEAARLVKPGGRVVLLNHFQSTRRLVAVAEKAINPLCMQLGWRSDLALSDLLGRTQLQMQYQFKLSAVDLWRIVVLSHGVADEAPAQNLAAFACQQSA